MRAWLWIERHLGDLFTPRQLVALTTFSDLVAEARERIKHGCRYRRFDSKTNDRCGMEARVQRRMQRRWGCTWRLHIVKAR